VPAPPVELCRRLTAGVYVITASHGGRRGGFTAAWVTQVSFDPVLLAVSINPGNATWALIAEAGRFAVNVLASGQQQTARHFGLQSGREVDKFPPGIAEATPEGDVVLVDAVSWLGCRVERQFPAGDHVVVLARVVSGDVLNPHAGPMRYADTGNMDGSADLFPTALRQDGDEAPAADGGRSGLGSRD
jgi:flavin reductase (DIM6/NTAB) family NADH-FMN oxidoreductase RutF